MYNENKLSKIYGPRLGTMVPLILLLFLLSTPIIRCAPNSVSFSYYHFPGVNVFVITANLKDPEVKVVPVLAWNRVGRAETYQQMIRRTQPTAAITGTFFSPRSLLPTGDIVVGGQTIYLGGVGAALVINSNNEVQLVPRKKYHHKDWSLYETVLSAGPRLVWNGQIWLDPYAEGFRDRRMINSRTTRLGIGFTADNRLKLVAAKGRVSLRRLAHIMLKLGCINAINVDQGGSAAFYYRGWTIVRPSRRLTNLLVIYDSPERYKQVSRKITPQPVQPG